MPSEPFEHAVISSAERRFQLSSLLSVLGVSEVILYSVDFYRGEPCASANAYGRYWFFAGAPTGAACWPHGTPALFAREDPPS